MLLDFPEILRAHACRMIVQMHQHKPFLNRFTYGREPVFQVCRAFEVAFTIVKCPLWTGFHTLHPSNCKLQLSRTVIGISMRHFYQLYAKNAKQKADTLLKTAFCGPERPNFTDHFLGK